MIRSHMTLPQVAAAARKDVGQLLRHVEEEHTDLAERGSPRKDAHVVRSGCFSSKKGLQWIYVVVAAQGRVTIYPLLWYATTKGTCAMQLDAEGPASFFAPHVLIRYTERFLRRGGDLVNALREFHLRNYDKTSQPCDYKGDRESYTAVIDHGYVAGEYLREDAIVFYRTFYDLAMGRKRFGELRRAQDWRLLMHTVDFGHVGRRDTPHFAWGRGYPFQVARWLKAAKWVSISYPQPVSPHCLSHQAPCPPLSTLC